MAVRLDLRGSPCPLNLKAMAKCLLFFIYFVASLSTNMPMNLTGVGFRPLPGAFANTLSGFSYCLGVLAP